MAGERGPEHVAEILGRLFLQRGWGRQQQRLRLDAAWRETAGAALAGQTSVGAMKRGVLEILVGDAVLLQELSGYRKRQLLLGLQQSAGGEQIKDLRFRLAR